MGKFLKNLQVLHSPWVLHINISKNNGIIKGKKNELSLIPALSQYCSPMKGKNDGYALSGLFQLIKASPES